MLQLKFIIVFKFIIVLHDMRLVVRLFLSVDGEGMDMDMLQENVTAIDEETINEEGEEDPRGSGDYKVHVISLEPLQ